MVSENIIIWWFIFLSPILFVVSLVHAYRTNKKDLNLLFAGTIFGYFLEFSSIKLFNVYYYNPNWPLNPWQLPLTVSVSWANLIYGTHLLANLTNLEERYKPIAQSIFATTLDWAMDPIAVRAKMWTWTINENPDGYDQQYFGIPWANFFGWMTAVYAFTFAYQYYSKKIKAGDINFHIIGLTFITSVVGAGFINGLFNLIFLEGEPVESGGRWIFIQGIIVVVIYFLGLAFIASRKPIFTEDRDLIPVFIYLSNMASYFFIGVLNEHFVDSILMLTIFLISFIIQIIICVPNLRKRYLPTLN